MHAGRRRRKSTGSLGNSTSGQWWLSRSAAVLMAVTVTIAPVGLLGAGTALAAEPCTPLTVYGIQGTGQSSPNAPADLDTGFLAEVMKPLKRTAGSLVDRKYVPYSASFGGAGPSTPGQTASYADSVQGAGNKAIEWANARVTRCPSTKFAFVGYSQGAHAVKGALDMILEGKSKVTPEQVAAVANFGDPARPAGASLFPGRPGQVSPSPIPGTSGSEVTKVVAASAAGPTGGGIGPTQDRNVDLTRIAGRYASFCAAGDPACDIPADSPLIRAVTNVAGQMQFDQGDPIRSMQTIANAIASTTIKAIVPIVTEDIPGGNVTSYAPKQTIAERIEWASDPRNPMPPLGQMLSAVFRVGMLGGGAASNTAPLTITPDRIMSAVGAGLSGNPLGLVTMLLPGTGTGQPGVAGGQAVSQAISRPLTGDREVTGAFDELTREAKDIGTLIQWASTFKFAEAGALHTSYGSASSTPTGMAPTQFVARWLTAAAKDSAAGGSSTSTTAPAVLPQSPILPLPTLPGLVSTAGIKPDMLGGLTGLGTTTPAPTSAPATVTASTAPAAPTVAGPDLSQVDLTNIINSVTAAGNAAVPTPTTTAQTPTGPR